MKKLIISAIAAASLLFGFASCSGDLHDDEYKVIDLSNGAIPGDFDSPANWDNTTQWTSIDTASNTYVFNFKTKSDLSGNVGFKILTENGTWNVDGYTEVNVTVGTGAVTIPMKSASEMGGAGNANIVGCEPGANYTMTVVANPDTTISVKVDAADSGTVQADPTPYYFDGLYLVGGVFKLEGKDNAFAFDTTNLLWGATTDKKTGVVTYTKDIVATAASGELGINDSSWNNKQKGQGVEIAAGEAAKPLDGKEGNFKVSGLTIGNPYRVTITTTPEKVVSVGIEEICAYTLKFKVTGLSEGDQVFINGTPWGSSWPNGWPILAWNSGNPAAKNVVIADSDGVATFDSTWDVSNVTKPGETLSYEAKLVYIADGEDWNAADVTINEFGNFKFDVEIVSAGTYLVTIDLASEEVTAEKQ